MQTPQNQECDEKGPRCTNCIKHRVECSFSICEVAPSSESMQKAPPFSSNQLLDLECLHHFTTVTYCTLSDRPGVNHLFQTCYITEALKYDYLIHGILCVSAFHMYQTTSNPKAPYLAAANAHYNTTIESFRQILAENITSTNCHSVFACSSMIFVASCARPKDDPPTFPRVLEWFILVRGIAALINPCLQWVSEGPFAKMASTLQEEADPGIAMPTEDLNHHFGTLLDYLSRSDLSAEDFETCKTCIELLRHTFYGLALHEVRSMFWWPTMFSSAFMNLLAAQSPPAMTILAYYCVMLHKRDSRWWIVGWPEYMMRVVQKSLDGRMSECMKWPLEVMGMDAQSKYDRFYCYEGESDAQIVHIKDEVTAHSV